MADDEKPLTFRGVPIVVTEDADPLQITFVPPRRRDDKGRIVETVKEWARRCVVVKNLEPPDQR